MLDAGIGGVDPTTVVDITDGGVRLVREGAGDPAQFRELSGEG